MSLDKDLLRVMLRIEKAEPDSPIAVFRTEQKGYVDAVFANTIDTQRRIKAKDKDLIGVFGANANHNEVRRIINNALIGK